MTAIASKVSLHGKGGNTRTLAAPVMPPTVAFTIDNVPSTEVSRRLATRSLFLSHGDFYAATVVERLGLGAEGLVRAGCACYTTEEEIDRLIEGVAEICT